MDERDIWNLQTTVSDQEQQIIGLLRRVEHLEMSLARVNRTLDEVLEQRFGRIWKAIRRLEGKELER